MANHLSQLFQNILHDFESLTESPESFLKPSTAHNQSFKNVSKKIFDAMVQANSLTNLESKSLPKLLVGNFDEEQIWQQVELQNKSAISHLDKVSYDIYRSNFHLGVSTETNGVPLNKKSSLDDGVSMDEGSEHDSNEESDENLDDDDSDEYIDLDKSVKQPKLKNSLEDDEGSNHELDDESDEDLDDDDSDEYIDLEEKVNQSKLKSNPADDDKSNHELDDESAENLDDEDSDAYIDLDKSQKQSKSKKDFGSSKQGSKNYKSEVDDQFFKLSKLEQFLRLEDLKEERSFDESKNDEELSSDEEIDLFQEIPSDDGDSEEESFETNSKKKTSKDLMYKDFFDAPESGDESAAENESSNEENENSDMDVDDEDLSDADSMQETKITKHDSQNEVASGKNSKNKTPFQIQQEKTKEQIAMFEKGLLEPSPWHLTGEVDASKRPSDALLHLQTDFEVNARPVLIEDKPLCEKLENMLKMTIKNKSYSDGVRQYKTNTEAIAEKKEVIIEQNKSSKSLAQEYEDMYLKQKHKPGEEENPKHVEIRKLKDSLFAELHALFAHIPKPAVPDIKIVSNLPAISVEEVAPTSVSDVTLLAPEEVKKRSGLIKGATERDATDKNRDRRKKKLKLKLKMKDKELEEKPASRKMQKREKLEVLKKLKQHRNTKIADVDEQKIKSSKDFFAKLQETVDSNTKHIRGKKKNN